VEKLLKKGVMVILTGILMFLLQSTGLAYDGKEAPGRNVTVRVMNYNIHAGIGEDGQYNIDRIADAIRSSGAEIIGLEEVDVHWGSRSNNENEIKSLAEKLNMNYYFAPIYDFDPTVSGEPRRQYGVAVLSSFPIIHAVNHEITRLSTQTSNPSPAPAPGFPEVTINIKGAHLSFFVTHLDYRSDPSVREMQVQDMLSIIHQSQYTSILAGDLNAEPGAPELAPLFHYFKDTWAAVNPNDPGWTYSAINPAKKIDFILADSAVQVSSSQVINTLASDHRPVIADVVLTRGE